jgi:hypothetical protein
VGNFKTEEEMETPHDQEFSALTESAARSVALAGHTEAAVDPEAPVQEQGKIKRQRVQETEAGNFRTEDEAETPHDQEFSALTESAGRSVEMAGHTEAAVDPEAPVQEQGVIKRQRVQETEAGNFKTEDEAETPHDQEFSALTESAGRSVALAGHTEAAVEPAAPVQEQGVIKRQRVVETEAGNFRTEEEAETPKDQVGSEFSVSGGEVVAIERHTEAAEALTEPAEEEGKIARVRSVPTDAGNHATELEERTAVTQDTGWVVYPDTYGDGAVRSVEHGTEADLADVVSGLSASQPNSLFVMPEGFPGRMMIRATRGVRAVDTMTTFRGALGVFTWDLTRRERRGDDEDPLGYEWREVTITYREYVGIVHEGGEALMGAIYNLNGGDYDSSAPELVGLLSGVAVWRSVRVTRAYGTWQAGGDDE